MNEPGGDGSVAPDPLLGRNIGKKFVLEKLLGAGAMGSVYRARQTALEKLVAIKVMKGDLARDPMFAARFHREAKAASRLDHPNSIRILDYGEDDDGLLYIAMEFLDGRDLAHLLSAEWPLSNARTIDLMTQALGAIAVAHDLGITHRDLKPENIMVLRRRTDDAVDIDVVKVCDFGIAKLVDASDDGAHAGAPAKGKLTTAGLVIGTPAYMSPEQGRGEPIDGRSDLYSMGVILFQCLTGELPFDAPSAIGIVVKHQTEPVPPPSSVRAGVDPRLEAICLKALSKRREDRYQTARDFRGALKTGDVLPGPIARDDSPAGILRAAASDHDVGVARTELQLSAVTTASTGMAVSGGTLDAQPLALARAPGSTARGRSGSASGLIVAAVVAIAAGVLWKTRSPEASPLPLVVEKASPTIAAAAPPRTVSSSTLVASPPESAATVAAAALTQQPAPPLDPAGSRRAALAPSTIHETAAAARPRAPLASAHDEAPAPVEVVLPPPAPPAPPPVAALAPAAAVPAAPPPVASPPAFDVTRATLVVGAAGNLENIASRYVNDALGHTAGTMKRCYVDALPGLTGAREGTGSLHIETDDSGTITGATLGGPVRGAVAKCIEDSVRGVRIEGVDTGAARADIPLEFKAR